MALVDWLGRGMNHISCWLAVYGPVCVSPKRADFYCVFGLPVMRYLISLRRHTGEHLRWDAPI